MKNFIKENLVLVIGLSLPILLIVIFFWQQLCQNHLVHRRNMSCYLPA